MATANGNHPPIEGIIPHSSVPGAALGPPLQGNQPGYPTVPQGGFGQQSAPPPYIGPQGLYGPPQHATGPAPPGFPVTNQPAPGNWMNMPPQVVPNCPPGLEYLTTIDHLLVHQEIDVQPVATRYESENRFTILNRLGQKVYAAFESSDACMRTCCGSFRPFDIKIIDNYGKSVISLNRPFACQWCCCPCLLQKMDVSAPPGNKIGSIEQEWSFWVPKFAIKNASGDVILRISGPFCTMACCGSDIDFQVLTSDGQNQVGKISKKWAGYASQASTNADNFGINFPMDLDVKMKAVMLGACFLIDMMYYEQRGKNNPSSSNTNPPPTTSGTTTVNRV